MMASRAAAPAATAAVAAKEASTGARADAGSGGEVERQRRVLIAVADGSEEIETVTVQDVLVRAGASVTLASVMEEGRCALRFSRGLQVTADVAIANVIGEDWDLVVVPGGMRGAQHCGENEVLQRILTAQAERGALLGAICVAPAVALAGLGILDGRPATCYPIPRFRDMLAEREGTVVSDDPVVVADGHIVTAQGPGMSEVFALKLVELLFGREQADSIAGALLHGSYAL